MNYARGLVGIDAVNDGAERWTGAGEIVGVLDSGVDRTHPDLADRVLPDSRGFSGGAGDDDVGHGTHVAGIVAATGAASGGELRGMAPEAQLACIGFVIDGNKVQDLPADPGDALAVAAGMGAKIINVSLGNPVGQSVARYDEASKGVDKFVRDHPDVLVVVAAGNEGSAKGGYPGLYTVGTPGTAKNVVTVGACTSSRPDFTDTWGAWKPERFPDSPTKEERMAGDADHTAALSSRGPTDFESVKPDLLAPGTHVLAPRAAKAPADHFFRDYPGHGGRYGFMNGTSMAAPVVSGAAAVLRQYLRTRDDGPKLDAPSAAALKSLLVAATATIPWHRPDTDRPLFGYPDFDQGFGRLDLRLVMPHGGAPPGRRVAIADVPNHSPAAVAARERSPSAHAASHRFRFRVAEGATAPLKVVLTWTDLEYDALQNGLTLMVTVPGNKRLAGNADHRWKITDARFLSHLDQPPPDSRNNVQAVCLPDPPAGAYTVRVLARQTLFPPQGYALCVCGELESDQLEDMS